MSESDEQVHRALGRIEGTQVQILSAVGNLHDDHKRLEKRTGRIERKLSWYAGAVASIAVVSTASIKYLWSKIT